MLNGIFWILCSGVKWRDLPERFGPWKTVYQRFRQWRDDGTLERILSRLHLKLREDGYMDLDTWMTDSISTQATRSAVGGGKKGLSGIVRPCPWAKPRRPDNQDPPGLRYQRRAPELPAIAWPAFRFTLSRSCHGADSLARSYGTSAQALPPSTGRLRLR